MAFRDVTPELMRRPLSVLVVNWRKIPITLINPGPPYSLKNEMKNS